MKIANIIIAILEEKIVVLSKILNNKKKNILIIIFIKFISKSLNSYTSDYLLSAKDSKYVFLTNVYNIERRFIRKSAGNSEVPIELIALGESH